MSDQLPQPNANANAPPIHPLEILRAEAETILFKLRGVQAALQGVLDNINRLVTETEGQGIVHRWVRDYQQDVSRAMRRIDVLEEDHSFALNLVRDRMGLPLLPRSAS